MRIHIRAKAMGLSLLITLLPFVVCGFGWEPIPADDPHITKVENSDVANQKTIYGQAISSAEFYNQQDEYENEIEELQKRIEELEKENSELKAKNNEYELNAELSESEWQALCKIAASEAGWTSAKAQRNIVKTIMNRVESNKFPNSIFEVINQPGQFEAYANGSYGNVTITEELYTNIKTAYKEWKEGDNAQGALYFCRGSFSGLTFLFTDEVSHNFYK